MKILVAEADHRARGGAEAYAEGLRRVLTGRGHLVGRIDVRGHQHPNGNQAPQPFLPGRTLWNWAQVCRALPRIAVHYDAVVLAFGEGPILPRPTLTIRHAPALFSEDADLIAHLGAKASALRRAYVRGCRKLARLGDSEQRPTDLMIANSRWTAKTIARKTDGICDGVLYPPLSPPPALPETERQAFGIVALGRLVPNKKFEDAIALADSLRARGLPANLTIIGRGSGSFPKTLAAQAASRPHVTLLQNASGPERAAALAQATLGFHGYRGEHFGIAVAEMILSGVLPLVHNSGGVRELVTESALRFEDAQDAIRRAERLFCRPDLARHYLAQVQASTALAQALAFDRHAGAVVDRWLHQIQQGPRDAAA